MDMAMQSPSTRHHQGTQDEEDLDMENLMLAMSTGLQIRSKARTSSARTPATTLRPCKTTRRFVDASDLDSDEEGAHFDDDDDDKENQPNVANTDRVTPSRLDRIKELRDELTCSICLEICTRPCTTTCGHTFCRSCLRQSLKHNSNCPKCRAHLTIDGPLKINTALWNTILLLFPSSVEPNEPPTPEPQNQPPKRASAATGNSGHRRLPTSRYVGSSTLSNPFRPPWRHLLSNNSDNNINSANASQPAATTQNVSQQNNIVLDPLRPRTALVGLRSRSATEARPNSQQLASQDITGSQPARPAQSRQLQSLLHQIANTSRADTAPRANIVVLQPSRGTANVSMPSSTQLPSQQRPHSFSGPSNHLQDVLAVESTSQLPDQEFSQDAGHQTQQTGRRVDSFNPFCRQIWVDNQPQVINSQQADVHVGPDHVHRQSQRQCKADTAALYEDSHNHDDENVENQEPDKSPFHLYPQAVTSSSASSVDGSPPRPSERDEPAGLLSGASAPVPVFDLTDDDHDLPSPPALLQQACSMPDVSHRVGGHTRLHTDLQRHSSGSGSIPEHYHRSRSGRDTVCDQEDGPGLVSVGSGNRRSQITGGDDTCRPGRDQISRTTRNGSETGMAGALRPNNSQVSNSRSLVVDNTLRTQYTLLRNHAGARSFNQAANSVTTGDSFGQGIQAGRSSQPAGPSRLGSLHATNSIQMPASTMQPQKPVHSSSTLTNGRSTHAGGRQTKSNTSSNQQAQQEPMHAAFSGQMTGHDDDLDGEAFDMASSDLFSSNSFGVDQFQRDDQLGQQDCRIGNGRHAGNSRQGCSPGVGTANKPIVLSSDDEDDIKFARRYVSHSRMGKE